MRRVGILAALLIVAIAGVLLSQTSTQNPHGTLKWDCQDCHTSESWSALRQPMDFDHDRTGFTLAGAHAAAQCIGCHKELVFSRVGTSCVDCHSDHHQGQVGLSCQNCHTTRNWENRQDQLALHARKGFPLAGVHAIADCEACHRGAQSQLYSGTPVDCRGCHEEAFTSTTSPNHVMAGFSTQCQDCHHAASGTWVNATYTHKTFALAGAHRSLTCNQCHSNGYAGTSTDCYSCHQTNFAGAKDPDHVAGNYDHNCILCHTVTAWTPATFDHATSAFPLTGAHAAVACVSCHTNGFANTPTDCYGCHQTSFASATNPNHTTNNFSHTCTTCHNTAAWSPSTFNHATTSFALTGAHTSVSCGACHTTGYTGGTPTDCYTCHQTAFAGTTDPNHVTNNFSHTCTTCHNTAAWSPSTFNHATTSFALTGAHTSVSCGACHTTGYTGGTPTDCYGCHQTAYQGTTDPNHQAQNFSHDCTQCHTTANWGTANFDHSATGFALTGAHTTATCSSCHTTGYSGGTPTDCYACHQTSFASASSPDHTANNFSHTCTTCHNTTAWQPSTFNHATTTFPLTGAHPTVACASCHANGYAGGTPTLCYSCHQIAFTGATDPNHVTNNFSHTCTTCHNTTAWSPSTFNHATTTFALTGAHITVACASCHTNGYTGGTPTDCYACHKSTYDATNNPAHAAAGFPTTCITCHTTTNWTSSTWNHDNRFPISSGRHSGFACTDCHVNPSNYATFECILCHTHSKSTTDGHHTNVNNYQYLSTACYSCHPRGNS